MVKEAGKNYFQKSHLLVAGLILLAFLVSFVFDPRIVAFATSLGSPLLLSLMVWVVYVSTPIIVLGSTLIVYFTNRRKLLALWTSLVVTFGLVHLIKIVVGRLRPFELGYFALNAPAGIIKESYSKWDSSFPSSHAATALAVLPFLPKKWRAAWIIFSVLVIISRVYFGLHYLSDVIAGAVFGLAIAMIIKEKMPWEFRIWKK